ncbi:fimbrial biogenesis outer membrane usher protein [Morganella morganii]|uniref:fimbria/pilus outer membrane usher protein n=1 Tax=Morganella morganii TaxID=582 RepID=UPI0015F5347B|nr:fimbria/pilus outer membrane usher protein [Morganella morganii]MBA5806644.1 fimbrial biogenesis outer membrane usher protein [Morganella morganii]
MKSSERTLCYSSILIAVLSGISTAGADDYFDPDFLTSPSGEALNVDLSAFEKSSFIPGNYRVDIYLNDKYVNTQEILFYNDKNANKLRPCFSDVQLADFGIKPEYYSLLDKSGNCVNLSGIQGADAEFKGNQNRLYLSMPQVAFDQKALDARQELLWDDGIPSVFTDYSFSGLHLNNSKNNNTDDSFYLNLRSGVNLGSWRYRNNSTWNKNTDGQQKWESQLNYIERPLRSIKSNFLVGDNFSDSDIFDNVAFRGIKLWSDDQMYPQYAGTYAPVINGVATTDSTIEIYQNGYVIYRTNVPAGPYELTDVVPLNSGENLYVVRKGIDGSEFRSVIPFSSLNFMQRKDRYKYSITAAQYRKNNYEPSENTGNKTKFVQADAFYGLTGNTTIFGGVQVASRYQAYDAGIGINIPVVGAIATDIMFTRAQPDTIDSMEGRAFRLRYSKSLEDTGTSISFAGYRYMSGDYLTMTDMFDYYSGQVDASAYMMRKGQLELTVTQNLPDKFGTLNASVSRQNYNTYYNNEEKSIESYNIGYGNVFKGVSLSVNYAYYKNSLNRKRYQTNYFETERNNDHVVSVNISIPLQGRFKDQWVNYGASYNKDGHFNNYVGVGGILLDDKNLSWNVQQGYGNKGSGNYGSVYGKYKGRYGDVNGGYSYKKDNRQISYGLNGSLIMSSYGATLSRPLGDTNGLIYAPGAEGIHILNNPGVATDGSGLAIVSNLIPYRNNNIRLDNLTLPENAEIETTIKEIYPTRGAIVLLDYKTTLGTKILVTLRGEDGQLIPFGAYVKNDNNPERVYVSNYGRLYLTGAKDNDDIRVIWGDKNQYNCSFSYDVGGKRKINGFYIFDAVCR